MRSRVVLALPAALLVACVPRSHAGPPDPSGPSGPLRPVWDALAPGPAQCEAMSDSTLEQTRPELLRRLAPLRPLFTCDAGAALDGEESVSRAQAVIGGDGRLLVVRAGLEQLPDSVRLALVHRLTERLGPPTRCDAFEGWREVWQGDEWEVEIFHSVYRSGAQRLLARASPLREPGRTAC